MAGYSSDAIIAETSFSGYDGDMVITLRESKAKLSELVQRASQGEDVLITVRGQIKARLTSATEPGDDRAVWIERLKTLQKKYTAPKGKTRMEDVLAETRQDRF